jgi:hypothetical protein
VRNHRIRKIHVASETILHASMGAYCLSATVETDQSKPAREESKTTSAESPWEQVKGYDPSVIKDGNRYRI